jgi:hypothetical protein
MAVTDHELALVHADNPLAETVSNQRRHIADLLARVNLAERQVRDLALHNERLQRENAELRSRPHA